MFNGKRLRAIEDRLDKLEQGSQLNHPTETEIIGSWFGTALTEPKRMQIKDVMYALLNHLKIDIKIDPAKPETLTAVKRK